MFIPKILSTYLFSGENFLLTHNFGLRLLSRHVSTKKILLYLSAEGMVNLSLFAEGSLISFSADKKSFSEISANITFCRKLNFSAKNGIIA